MSASLHFLSFTPQALSLHHSSSSSSSHPSLFTSASLRPLPKQAISLVSVNKHEQLGSRFVRNVAVSSEVEDEEESLDFSGSQDRNSSNEFKLFVGNLPFDVDSAALAGLFEQAGNVEMVEVIYDKITGRSRGFGFVTMSSMEDVEAAAQQFNGYELQGRAIRVNYGPPPPKRDDFSSRGPRGGGSSGSTNRVYVGNLSWGVDDDALRTLFSEQGRVTEARVVYDRESGRSRGFGFVTYSTPDEVNKAVDSLDGCDLDGRTIRVSPAEDRPRRQF